MGCDNLWEFLGIATLLFLSTWFASYTILRIAKTNKTLYLVVHPVVTFVFGNMIVFLFFVIGWVVSLNIIKDPPPTFWELGRLMGWIIGALVVARIYLIEEENTNYEGWLYFLAILSGLIMYLAGPFGAVGKAVPKISLIRDSPVPLMYLGYLAIKLRIWYLRRRRINRWREEGLK
jgi:hypothetical protein